MKKEEHVKMQWKHDQLRLKTRVRCLLVYFTWKIAFIINISDRWRYLLKLECHFYYFSISKGYNHQILKLYNSRANQLHYHFIGRISRWIFVYKRKRRVLLRKYPRYTGLWTENNWAKLPILTAQRLFAENTSWHDHKSSFLVVCTLPIWTRSVYVPFNRSDFSLS